MSPFDLLYEPPWQRGTLTLFHFLWQGFAVALGLLAVLWLFRVRQARARYALSLLALLAMAACPLVTLAVLDGSLREVGASVPPPEANVVSRTRPSETPRPDVKGAEDASSQAAQTVPNERPSGKTILSDASNATAAWTSVRFRCPAPTKPLIWTSGSGGAMCLPHTRCFI